MKLQLKPIAEQAVVVFGASSGIGRETALQFANKGAAVVVAARNGEALNTLVSEIETAGGRATAVVADVTDSAQVKAVADVAVEKYGRLDTWVHLAAAAMYATFEQTTPEEFKRIIDVTLTGAAYGAMAALPLLRQAGGGALIQVSSIEAEIGFPYQSAYAAAKHGMKGYLDVLRLELQHEKFPISVTNIMPAGINTPFFDHARTKLGVKPIATPPLYEPRIVADAILHAAENPTPEIIVGGNGWLMVMTKRYAPSLADRVLHMIGFGSQRTKQPKPANAPTNLFTPLPEQGRVEGEFDNLTRGTSVHTYLATHPNANMALKAALIGTAAMLVTRSFRKRDA